MHLRLWATHCWSAGLAVYLRAEDEATIMDFPHHKIWARMPFVNLSDSAMFVRGVHGHNDARTPFQAAHQLPGAPEALETLLMQRFGIDFAAFQVAWGRRSPGS